MLKSFRWRFAAAVVAMAALTLGLTGCGDESKAKAPEKNYSVYKEDHLLGSPKAPVVMIEYAAPSCPHCARFFLQILPELKKEYIDTGKVLYVLRVHPLMPADGAIEAVALSLPKDKYFAYIGTMYRNQPEWDPEYGVANVRDAILKQSAPFGITSEKFDKIISNSAVLDSLNRVAQDGQMRYGIKAVPTFVVNGAVKENSDWPELKAVIDAALVAARK